MSNSTEMRRKMVPLYKAEDFFTGKKGARPVGRVSDPDRIGTALVDRETLFRLAAIRDRNNETDAV